MSEKPSSGDRSSSTVFLSMEGVRAEVLIRWNGSVGGTLRAAAETFEGMGRHFRAAAERGELAERGDEAPAVHAFPAGPGGLAGARAFCGRAFSGDVREVGVTAGEVTCGACAAALEAAGLRRRAGESPAAFAERRRAAVVAFVSEDR